MMKRLLIGVAFTLQIVATSHCLAEERQISASACKKRLAGGTVVDCEVSSDLSTKLHAGLRGLRLIDERYPGPQRPDTLHEVTEVDDRGRIRTKDGDVLMLAGVKCDTGIFEYLRASVGMGSKLAFLPVGDEKADIKYVYAWEVTASSYSSLNEAGITTKWCSPVPQKGHRYHERYKALEQLIESL